MKKTTSKFSKKTLFITINILFLIVLWFPLIQMQFHIIKTPKSRENRLLAPLPTFKNYGNHYDLYLKDFESYFSDHFGFRRQLMNFASLIKIKILKTSSYKNVILGKDGWLFYTNPQDGSPISDYMGLVPFDNSQIDLINELNQIRYKWFESRNIKLLIVFPPDKQEIYPDFLPDKLQKKGQNRLDQIIKNNNSGIQILDLRPVLQKNKDKNLLYYKTDTHWNRYGAYLASKKILQNLGYNIKDYYTTDVKFSPEKLTDPKDLVTLMTDYNIFNDYEMIPDKETIKKTSSDKIMIFGDSFALPLNEYFESIFPNMEFVRLPQIDYDLVEKENAKIVIWEIVGRYATNLFYP